MLTFRTLNYSLGKAAISSLTTLSKAVPAILEIRTWSPAIKQTDEKGNIISTIPMTSLEAKRARISFDSKNGRSISIFTDMQLQHST